MLAVLALAVGASAQRRGGGRAGRPAAAAVSSDMVQSLYQQAKAASAAVPAVLAPRLYIEIANDEVRLFPEQAAADYQTAFSMALALNAGAGDGDSAAQARENAKQAAELEAVSGLARAGDRTEALALTRHAELPKGPLYDELIVLAGMGGGGGFWRRAASHGSGASGDDSGAGGDSNPGSFMDQVFALVEECEHAGGGFPFRGVAAAIRRRDADGLGRLTLVREGYRAALDAPPDQGAEVAMFLQSAHRAEPALDGVLESTLVSLLGRAAGSTGLSSAGTATSASQRFLALLRQIDAPQAEALAQLDPALSLPPASPAARLSMGNLQIVSLGVNSGATIEFSQAGARFGGATPFRFVMNVAAPAPAASDAGAPEAEQFRSLLARAESQVRRQPGVALGLANQAADLLNDAMLASNLAGAARLAQLYSELDDNADAGMLLGRCLDEADREASAFDANYQGGDSGQQAQLAAQLESAEAPVIEVYSLAARLDFTTAAERAEAAQFTLLKPAVLARVAMVGEVGQRPPAAVIVH